MAHIVEHPSAQGTQLAAGDRINVLAAKARGMLQVMRAANPDDLPDGALHDASWAVEGMLEELTDLALQQIQQ